MSSRVSVSVAIAVTAEMLTSDIDAIPTVSKTD